MTLLPQHAGGASYSGYRLSVYHSCQSEPLASAGLYAEVRSARFELSPQIFELKRAFVGVAHEVVLRVRNVSDVVGRWTFPAQERSDACIIQSEL